MDPLYAVQLDSFKFMPRQVGLICCPNWCASVQ